MSKVLIDRELLERIHRDLDACQKVIWLAGVRPRGYGFDPAYVNDAQARLKEIDELLNQHATDLPVSPGSNIAAPITCEQIQQCMTGGGCPTAGSLGECAAMWCNEGVWTAALYIWNPSFHDSSTVAGWFRSLGASEIEITHTLYSTANGDRDGQCFEGVTRQWLVQFTMREAPRELRIEAATGGEA